MKDTTKTIIIGVVITILVLILTIFILYKVDSKKLKDENTTNKNNYNNSTPTIKTDNNSNNTTNTPSKNNETNTIIKDDEKNDKIILYMFHGSTCPHCVKAIETMKNEKNTTFKNVEIRTFEIYKNKVNSELYKKVTDKLKVNVNSVPYFVIGDYNRVGFNAEIGRAHV